MGKDHRQQLEVSSARHPWVSMSATRFFRCGEIIARLEFAPCPLFDSPPRSGPSHSIVLTHVTHNYHDHAGHSERPGVGSDDDI